MSKFSENKEGMIDDVALEIEFFDSNSHEAHEILRKINIQEKNENIDYFVQQHRKLFNVEYYKFFNIQSIEDHPKL